MLCRELPDAGFERGIVHAPLLEVPLILTSRQVTTRVKQTTPLFDGRLKRHVFQAMQRIVVDERTHGPEIRYRLGRHVNHRADIQLFAHREFHDIPPTRYRPAMTSEPRPTRKPEVDA